MAREDLVEGLKQAVARGESSEKAVASFYNAGYPQDEIEDAARVLKMQSPFQSQVWNQQQKIPAMPTLSQTQTQSQPSAGVVQRVSEYGKKPSKTGAIITVMLFLLLLSLLGILAAVVFFKEELSDFLSNLLFRSLL